MTQTDLERRLTTWLEDTARPRRPEYTTDVLRLTAGRRQRPRWSFVGRLVPRAVAPICRTAQPLPWRTIGLLALLGTLLAAGLAIYASSRPPLPDPLAQFRNGVIVYGANGDIVAVDPATGETSSVVAGTTDDSFPALSPDGQRIAFQRSDSGGEYLFASTLTGDDEQKLVAEPVGGVRGLSWSPDGSALVFANGDLWVVPVAGSTDRPLNVGFRAEFPVWRPPTGAEILFSNGSGPGLFLIRRDGTVLRPLTFPDGTIVDDEFGGWTPDGLRLVSLRGSGEAAGQPVVRLHVLTVGPDGRIIEDREIGPPVLPGVGNPIAPDGTKVFFAHEVPGQSGWQIGVIAIDGSVTVVVTGPTFLTEAWTAGWAPDGTTIVVNDLDRAQTWLLDPNGGPGRLAGWTDTSGEPPAWQRVVP